MSKVSQRMFQLFAPTAARFLALALVVVFSAGVAAAQAYVADFSADAVRVIDPVTHTVTATVPVGDNPVEVAVTPDGSFVYVSNNGNGANSVSVINTGTNTVVATVPVGPQPRGLAVTPDGAFVYVANNSADYVSVINTTSNMVVTTVTTGFGPSGVAITPDGAFAYVTSAATSTVSVIDTVTNMVIATVPVGSFPQGVAITPDGAFAYVAAFGADEVDVISTASNMVVATISGIPGAYRIAITPNGASAYVTTSSFFVLNQVYVINIATNAISTTVPAQGAGVAVTPDGAFAWVSNEFTGTITEIDTGTNMITTTFPAGVGPGGLAFRPTPPPPQGPTSKEQCKNGGWQTFTNPTFTNQGDCISYVNHL